MGKKIVYYPGYNLRVNKSRSLMQRIKDTYVKGGLRSLIKKVITYIFHYKVVYYLRKIDYTFFRRYFIVNGRKFRYYYKSVNSERIIEIPFTFQLINKYRNGKILEVGNVMSNYFKFDHDIIDKYEIAEHVLNKDIIKFNTNKRYDLIISVSTIEHVGFDEPVRQKGKSLLAIKK